MEERGSDAFDTRACARVSIMWGMRQTSARYVGQRAVPSLLQKIFSEKILPQ
jgi:hypothetical protein